MSLIERMIQRTRAPHSSSIQPLLPPRFATSMVALEVDDTFLVSNQANPLGLGAASIARVPRIRVAAGDELQPHPSSAFPTRSFQQETTAVPFKDGRLSGDSIRQGDFPPITQKIRAADNTASQHRDKLADADQHVERSPQSIAEPIHSPVTTFGAERSQAVSQQYSQQSSISNGARVRHRSEDEAGEKRTAPDVSITIGHIEVHAAQPPERVPRPAFRPRVSLDDFLGQRSGKQS